MQFNRPAIPTRRVISTCYLFIVLNGSLSLESALRLEAAMTVMPLLYGKHLIACILSLLHAQYLDSESTRSPDTQ